MLYFYRSLLLLLLWLLLALHPPRQAVIACESM